MIRRLLAASAVATLIACQSEPPGRGNPPPEAAEQDAAPLLDPEIVEAREDSVSSADGVVIRFKDHGAGEPAVVFVHGWACDQSYWKWQVPHFAAARRVITLDLAGHGASGSNRGEWTVERFAQDVAAVVAALGLERTVLIGHSMGGSVVLEAAPRLEGKVAAIIGVDTFQSVEGRLDEATIETFVGPMRRDFQGAVTAFVKSLFADGAAPELVASVAADMSSAPPGPAVEALVHLFRHDAGAAFERAGVPIRVLASEKFPIDVEAARRHTADFDIRVVKGAGHFLMLENPSECNRLLDELLAQIAAGS